mmetsp:Transcript_52792/g.104874  ORF Transcript_52792/g.104874 Transcript_52792/m.104874 type:complete len:320 (+) Transcript_52792:1931-2890(+)
MRRAPLHNYDGPLPQPRGFVRTALGPRRERHGDRLQGLRRHPWLARLILAREPGEACSKDIHHLPLTLHRRHHHLSAGDHPRPWPLVPVPARRFHPAGARGVRRSSRMCDRRRRWHHRGVHLPQGGGRLLQGDSTAAEGNQGRRRPPRQTQQEGLCTQLQGAQPSQRPSGRRGQDCASTGRARLPIKSRRGIRSGRVVQLPWRESAAALARSTVGFASVQVCVRHTQAQTQTYAKGACAEGCSDAACTYAGGASPPWSLQRQGPGTGDSAESGRIGGGARCGESRGDERRRARHCCGMQTLNLISWTDAPWLICRCCLR